MSRQRLQTQFSKLYSYFDGKETETTIQNMSDVLCCTNRNARIVLNKMMNAGWLEWLPAVGRGNQSRLVFRRNDADIQKKRVEDWFKRGELDHALPALSNDKIYLTSMIDANLGFHESKDRTLCLPYYRSIENLNPAKPIRKTERMLVDQIFNRLTRYNPKTKKIEGDLAYRWEMISLIHWRFYLRRAVRFHDGSILSTEDVIESIKQANAYTYFSHIKEIVSISAFTLDFYLSTSDRHFPELLSHSMLSIQPRVRDKNKLYDRMPIGTGPYHVVTNTPSHLTLQAHHAYFGYSPLIERVEIWAFHSEILHYLQPSRWQNASLLETRQDCFNDASNKPLSLETGSVFLLLNCQNGLPSSPDWRQYLCARLSPLHLLPLLHAIGIDEYKIIHSRGLLPEWMHVPADYASLMPPEKCRVRLVYQKNHPLYHSVAKAIAILVERDGIPLSIQGLSYQEMMLPKQNKQIDIWIGHMHLNHHLPANFFAAIFDNGLFRAAMPDEEWHKIETQMWQWRKQDNTQKDDMRMAEVCARTLVQQQQILPLFHSWTGQETCADIFKLKTKDVSWGDFKSMR